MFKIKYPYLLDWEGNNHDINNFTHINKSGINFYCKENENLKINDLKISDKKNLEDNDIIEIDGKIYRFVNNQKKNNKSICNDISNKLKTSDWNFEEREYLKKALLSFGYGNWEKIINSPDSILFKKKIDEIRAYSNSLLRSCIDNISYDNLYLKEFLIKIIENNPNDNYIFVNYKDWDLNYIGQRANPWAKRFYILYNLKLFIKSYESFFMKKNKRFPDNIFDYNNLLNFLGGSILLGQRPTTWWTRNHDIDLLLSTYKNGYANYNYNIVEFNDKDENELVTFFDNPTSDAITRRLKKLIQWIKKENKNIIDFDNKIEADSDLDNLSFEFKKNIFELVKNYGIPLNKEFKYDWNKFITKFNEITKNENNNIISSAIERLIHQLRIICIHLINDNIEIDNKNYSFINYKKATKFINNPNLFHFFRKYVQVNNYNLFVVSLNDLKLESDKLKENVSGYINIKNYSIEKYDKEIIQNICENGFINFNSDSENKVLIEDIKIDKNILYNRINFLTKFFKKKLMNSSNYKKKINKTSKIFIKSAYININTLPCQVSYSLKLLSIGKIKIEKKFHSENNLFPVGFKTIRTHASPFKIGEKCDYECEILDGGEKPIFKLTCLEDPKNPVLKDTSTGCWLHFCNMINEISENKKAKVTVSGTERFGLQEPAVVRVLEDLENSDKCKKYIFKSKPKPN